MSNVTLDNIAVFYDHKLHSCHSVPLALVDLVAFYLLKNIRNWQCHPHSVTNLAVYTETAPKSMSRVFNRLLWLKLIWSEPKRS